MIPGIRITTVCVDGGTYVCTLVGEFDSASVQAVEAELDATLELGASGIVIDLMRLTVLDSAGLGLLLRAADRLAIAAGRLAVVSDDPRTLRLFDVTGLDRQFVVQPSVAAAIDAVAPTASGSG